MSSKASKFCLTCGRTFTYRASHGSDWESVRYCSARCRSSKPNNKVDSGIERSFLRLLRERVAINGKSSRDGGKVLCEEVQAADGTDREELAWRERYRRAARRLANVHRVCEIEHEEGGKWLQGDGKGKMRVCLIEGSDEKVNAMEEGFKRSATTASANDNTQ